MTKLIKILRGIIFTLYLAVLFYVSFHQANITEYFNPPVWLIPIIIVSTVIIFGAYFINLFLKIESLEFEFTSIVNHVFRTPLTRIMWISKELEKELDTKEKDLYLQNLKNAATRILDIVDIIAGIKNVNVTQGYFFQAVHVREIIEKSISKYREATSQKNITFNVANLKDIPLLTIDLKKISFVLDVLMENSIFYTPKDGQISVDAVIKSDKLLISITDTGIGFSFKQRIRLFSKFYRGKEAKKMYTDGMGLGLYLSKMIVRRHKGKLYARSGGENKGATFFLELPLTR